MELNLQAYGAGYPLIVLHGLFGSLANWHSVSKTLAEHFQVLAVDLRNHGGSPHSDEINYPLMAEDLRETMAAQQIERAHLLGHSMGGKAAMQFAATYPDRVNKLIVVDIAPKAYSRHHDEILDALCDVDLSAYGSRTELDRALAPRLTNTAERQFLLTNAVRDPNGRFTWRMNLPALAEHYDALVAGLDPHLRFDGPTLFIRGERSEYVRDDDAPLITSMFPRATIVTVAGAGHWVHAEAPKELVRLVLEFLST